MEEGVDKILDKINFRIKINGEDLAVAVAQDYKTKEVLMVAFINREAFKKTLETGLMHYYSTSRRKLWLKGESSGHHQVVKEIYIDCDADSVLFVVEQKVASCHDGYYSCFYRKIEKNEIKTVKERIFNPEEVYKK